MASGGCAFRGTITWLLIISLVVVGFIGLLGDSCEAVEVRGNKDTIIVDINGDGDYTSIQEAINKSVHGGTIYVRPGEYHENIRIFKTLSLIGTHMKNTTINGSSGWGSVVEISVNSVTLTGFTINGNSLDCIKLEDVQYVRVSNNNCSNNVNGIALSDSDYNYIENNKFYWNEYCGIFLWNSDFNTINNNTILINRDDNPLAGIGLHYSKGNIITNNSMSNQGVYIYSESLSHWIHTIENNTLNNKQIIYWKDKLGGEIPPGTGQVILVNCSRVTVENQNCSDGTIGISLVFSNNITVRNNTSNRNNWVAITLWSSVYNNLTNNTCKFNCGGIFLYYGSQSNNIINNIFHSNVNQDIDLYQSNSNVIINNSCSTSYGGIHVYESTSTTIINNSCYDNSIGIILYECKTSIIKNNEMISCGLKIYGTEDSHWDTHTLDFNNTVNGKNIYYWKNVRNVNFTLEASQIILINCSNIIFESRSFTDMSVAISLAFSNNITIRDCYFDSNVNAGIELWYSECNTIENNVFGNNSRGVELGNSNRNSINNNTCNFNVYGIYLDSSDSNAITNNSCISNKVYGIWLFDSDKNELKHNNFSLNNYGIRLWQSNSTIIFNNSCNLNERNGILIIDSRSNIIEKNTCTLTREDGIGISLSNRNVVINNTIYLNYENGIKLKDSYKNFISDNSIYSNNESGILLMESNQNLIALNSLSENRYGIRLILSSNNNDFSRNIFSSNSRFDFYILEDEKNNIIHHNHFISLAVVRDLGNNYWNNSRHQGNYWSDYTGVDNGADGRPKGDGIGDTRLPHQSVDYYPFENPGTESDDTGSGGGDGDFWITIPFCRTLSFLIIVILIILLLLRMKFLKKIKPKKVK